MNSNDTVLATIRARIKVAAKQAGYGPVKLLAVSKTRPAANLRQLADQGQQHFGENYVQEALSKQQELADTDLQWHFIGPLQSNKCRDVAQHFDWLESLDRHKLIEPLSRFRPSSRSPLNVLIEVNIDSESDKSGCAPEQMATLAKLIAKAPMLHLRGLMAIPAPHENPALRQAAFRRMRKLFEQLREGYPQVDTLSMGMSDDFETAIAEGATEVRIGTRLFGPRH